MRTLLEWVSAHCGFWCPKNHRGGLGTVRGNHPTLAKLTAIYMCRCKSPVHVTDNFTSIPAEGRYSLVIQLPTSKCRAVASLTVPGGKSSTFLIFSPNFDHFFLIFPQTFLIFFLILALRVGESPTREGPGYDTECLTGGDKVTNLTTRSYQPNSDFVRVQGLPSYVDTTGNRTRDPLAW